MKIIIEKVKRKKIRMRSVVKISWLFLLLFSAIVLSGCGSGEAIVKKKVTNVKQVAITVDDLPFAITNEFVSFELQKEMFNRFLDVLSEKKAVVAGFLIGSHYTPEWEPELIRWIKEGNILANHTYSHLNSNEVSGEEYVKDIMKCDSVLHVIFEKAKRELNIPFTSDELVEMSEKTSLPQLIYPGLNVEDSTKVKKILIAPKEEIKKVLKPKYNLSYKYFRFPYLNRGNTAAKKYIISTALEKANYKIAPVTITSNDWRFNPRFEVAYFNKDEEEMENIQKEYLKRIARETYNSENYAIQTFHREVKQILLFHLNILNAMTIGKIIDWYRENGWEIVDLDTVLKDEVYEMEDTYNGEYGIPWLFRAKRIRRATENPIAWGN